MFWTVFVEEQDIYALNRGWHRQCCPITMNKTTSLYAVAITFLVAGIMARIRAAMEKQIPVGYQDESGFHLGNEPRKK
jgi:hypothetical protein